MQYEEIREAICQLNEQITALNIAQTFEPTTSTAKVLEDIYPKLQELLTIVAPEIERREMDMQQQIDDKNIAKLRQNQL